MYRQSRAGGRHLAELVAVAAQVGQGDHFVLLIVVAENQQPRAQLVAHRLNPLLQLDVVERLVRLQFELRVGLGDGAHAGDYTIAQGET